MFGWVKLGKGYPHTIRAPLVLGIDYNLGVFIPLFSNLSAYEKKQLIHNSSNSRNIKL